MGVKVGDTIGIIVKVLSDSQGRENYWKLKYGIVKSIITNGKGRRVKAEHFYTLDGDEIDFNTKWMTDNDRLILTGEPFILTDELRERVACWIDRENELEQELME